MPWYRRLRWRLVAPQFLVVIVGVGIMLLATWLIVSSASLIIRPSLQAIAENPIVIDESEAELVKLFRNGILISVFIAAALALIAGVASAVVLWRIIIAPLHQVAHSSRRIADGRYSERVTIPTNSGQAMAQLVFSFNQMANALAQAEQTRVALLSNVTHELRTPLTGLRGYVEGMRDGLFPANEKTYSWMSLEIERLQRLVDDIQNLSRIESGQFSLNLEEFELCTIIHRVIRELQPQAQSNHVALVVHPLSAPITVRADADRTTQVLINLIDNAIRYAATEGQVVVSVSTDGRYALIRVQDDGIGIPAEAIPYLFERFYRVDSSRARKSGGSGIGLTISRHLVWAMGGEMTATSQGDGQGSTFSFTLRLA